MTTNKTFDAIVKEIEFDKEELRQLGLLEEEVEGYADFFQDNYFTTEIRKDLN